VNHDDRVKLPPEDYRQWPMEEIAGLFNEFTETIAEIVTPDDTESALQNIFDRLKSDQSIGVGPGKPIQKRRPPAPEGAGMAPRLGGLLSGQARAAADPDGMGAAGALPDRGGALRMAAADDSKSDHARPDTALIAGTIALVQSRDTGRAADRTVEALALLAVFSRDLRMMNPGDREETRALLAGARELLSSCPAGALGAEGSAMVLGTVATVAERLIAGRDERAALSLVRAASRHLKFLGRHDLVVFEVRRAEAEALSELGQYERAETMLRRLADDEQRAGAADPRTVLLLHWAQVGRDRPFRAEEGYRSLENHLEDAKRGPRLDRLLLHTRCRRAWVLGQLGRTEDSVSAYDQVISDRTRALGESHAETLDARHSKLKTLVAAGQFEHAVPLLKRLLDDREDTQGADHPDTLETRKYDSVALALAQPDDRALRDAADDLEEILHVQEERLGLGHPMRRDTAEWRERLLHVQANRDREQAARLSPAVPAATAKDHAAAVAQRRPVQVGW
jgi:tetratricopeptide (TPR) repeat protein